MALLKAVREQQPDSMDTLAKVVGKQAPQCVAFAAHHGGVPIGQIHQDRPYCDAAGNVRAFFSAVLLSIGAY